MTSLTNKKVTPAKCYSLEATLAAFSPPQAISAAPNPRKAQGLTKKKSKEQQKSENFRRQVETILCKCHRLSGFDAEVYFHVRRKGKSNIFTTYQDGPPGSKEIARYYPLPVIKRPQDYQKETKSSDE
ncbi:hypothetical protein MMC29_004060 [Sticta canariensis]|nr:hypothetical protein [Sticta canariensis]